MGHVSLTARIHRFTPRIAIPHHFQKLIFHAILKTNKCNSYHSKFSITSIFPGESCGGLASSEAVLFSPGLEARYGALLDYVRLDAPAPSHPDTPLNSRTHSSPLPIGQLAACPQTHAAVDTDISGTPSLLDTPLRTPTDPFHKHCLHIHSPAPNSWVLLKEGYLATNSRWKALPSLRACGRLIKRLFFVFFCQIF